MERRRGGEFVVTWVEPGRAPAQHRCRGERDVHPLVRIEPVDPHGCAAADRLRLLSSNSTSAILS